MSAFDQKAFNQFVVDTDVYGFFDEAITLKSGRQSHFYANFRTVVEDVWRTERLVEFVLNYVADLGLEVDTFYGVPEGATKLGLLTQSRWAQQQSDYGEGSHTLAMGRAKPKDHGAPKDRFFVGMPTGKVIMLEDVTTTGGSAIKSLEFLKDSGVDVVAMIGLTNRMEKRDDGLSIKEAVDTHGVPYYNMSSALEILPAMYAKLKPGEEIGRAVESEYAQYGVESIKLA
jgi:orotate phosphoribosyltransferase